MEDKRALTATWFKSLRDKICLVFEDIEKEFALNRNNVEASSFERKAWKREGGGGGVMSIMHGNVFEKVGVNISTVHGEFSEHMRKQIPGKLWTFRNKKTILNHVIRIQNIYLLTC